MKSLFKNEMMNIDTSKTVAIEERRVMMRWEGEVMDEECKPK